MFFLKTTYYFLVTESHIVIVQVSKVKRTNKEIETTRDHLVPHEDN